MTKKNHTVKVSESLRRILSVVLVVIIVAILMMFAPVSEFVAGVLGTTPERVQEVAADIIIIGIAIGLLIFAVLTASLPFIPIALAVVGGAMLLYQAYRWLAPRFTSSE
jgi:hypothetical protein